MLKNLLFKNLQDLLVNVFMLFFFKELKRILGDALQRKSGQCLILIIIATCLYQSNKGKGGCERLPEKKTERHSGPFCQPLKRIFLGEYTKNLFRPTYQNICPAGARSAPAGPIGQKGPVAAIYSVFLAGGPNRAVSAVFRAPGGRNGGSTY